MAQTGFTPLLIYSSSTAAAAPAAGSLTNSTLGSELAINITDGKLFYKDNANAVQVIGWKTTPTTAGGTGLTSYTAGDLLYYATGTTLTKLGIGAANTVLTSSGTAPQWSTNLNIGSLTATSISDSGNLTFTGTGNRITGDFSSSTAANRVAFQTTTPNAITSISALPLSAAWGSSFRCNLDPDPANTSFMQISQSATEGRITCNITGTGTYLPMTFHTGGTERARIAVNGDFSFNSGYGSAAVAYGCRAWVNFDGTSNTANLSGTYSQSGTTVTVTATAHGLIAGNVVYSDITTGTAVDGTYTVATVISSSQFTYTAGTSLTTSGNVTLRRNTIRASGNVSSIADNATGDYTINFTTAMPDANYSVSGAIGQTGSSNATFFSGDATQTITASQYQIKARTYTATFADCQYVFASFFR